MSDDKAHLETPVIQTGLDTGTGGFEVDGQTYVYDVGVPDADGGAQGKFDKGDISVDDSKKDLSKPTKETLATFLSNVTYGKAAWSVKPNAFPIDAKPYVESGVTDEKGFPSPVVPSKNSSQYQADLPTSFSQEYPSIQQDIKKGSSSKPGIDGNSLLKNEQKSVAVVNKYTSEVLKKNRFSPQTFDAQKQKAELIGLPAANPIYDPRFPERKGTNSFSATDGKDVSFGRLAQIGALLTLRSSAELTANSPGTNPNAPGTQVGALLPGTAQLGVTKVRTTLLNASDVLKDITKDETENYINVTSDSWGTLNNTEDQFSGISALGMVALSTALIGSLQVVIEGLSLLLINIGSSKQMATDTQGRNIPGQHYGPNFGPTTLVSTISDAATGNISALLGIAPTQNVFGECLRIGSRAFFGIDDSSIGKGIASFITRQFDSPGYNAILARAIIRSGVVIIDKLKGVTNGSPIDGAKQLMDLVDVIKSSKIIAAINIFAQLGDAILSTDLSQIDSLRPGLFMSKIDSISDDAMHSSHDKNRLKDSKKLAWASDRSYSNLLTPSNLAVASVLGSTLGANNVSLSRSDKSRTFASPAETNASRFSAETVQQIESLLDSEYVPFYFHDIRTNEIIGFHAFLASLNDDYSANYESSNGIGRVEQTKVYGSTTRKIGFSFYIAATGQEDFETMWAKINKLVTLLYPQYTEGKLLISKDKNYVFEQPFSQLVGASPLVRIRIGDLVRSNYSRFNLARLFGFGRPEFKLNNTSIPNIANLDASTAEKLKNAIAKALTTPGEQFVASAGKYEQFVDLTVPIKAPTVVPNALTYMPDGCTAVKILSIDPNSSPNAPVVIGEVVLNDTKFVNDNATQIKQKYADPTYPSEYVVGGKYRFPISALTPSEKLMKKLVFETYDVDANTSSNFIEALEKFMSPNGNAVVKSFKETGGKGLAGFIDTMNFDWNDKVTWNTEPGQVAPKMCKVTVAFSPIHDISPGIDVYGYNRAPVYQVGAMAKKFDSEG